MFELSEKSIANMAGCNPKLKQIAFRAIEITPIDFGIPSTGGSRTAKEQAELFKLGRSKCDGYEKLSKHQIKEGESFCKAIDYYAYIDGHASWKELHLALIATAFLQAACELGYIIGWAGLWKSWQEYPHIQLNEDL